jgi:hypothetical protein
LKQGARSYLIGWRREQSKYQTLLSSLSPKLVMHIPTLPLDNPLARFCLFHEYNKQVSPISFFGIICWQEETKNENETKTKTKRKRNETETETETKTKTKTKKLKSKPK